MLPSEPFGTAYGRRITRYLLDNPRGTQVAILDLGGIVQEFSVLNHGRRHPLIASLPDAAAYAADRFQLNKQIGRVAGRIRTAEFELGGRSYRIEANENGHNLHGGSRGDMVVEVQVQTPTRLSKEQKELLRQFAASMGDEISESHSSGGIFGKKKK